MDPNRKTGNYLSVGEACKLIGIDTRTYERREGTLFPKAKRLPNGFRIFTNEDVRILKEIWQGRKRQSK